MVLTTSHRDWIHSLLYLSTKYLTPFIAPYRTSKYILIYTFSRASLYPANGQTNGSEFKKTSHNWNHLLRLFVPDVTNCSTLYFNVVFSFFFLFAKKKKRIPLQFLSSSSARNNNFLSRRSNLFERISRPDVEYFSPHLRFLQFIRYHSLISDRLTDFISSEKWSRSRNHLEFPPHGVASSPSVDPVEFLTPGHVDPPWCLPLPPRPPGLSVFCGKRGTERGWTRDSRGGRRCLGEGAKKEEGV